VRFRSINMQNRSQISLVIIVVFLTVTFAVSLSQNWFYLHYGFEIEWILLAIGIIAGFLLLAFTRARSMARRDRSGCVEERTKDRSMRRTRTNESIDPVRQNMKG